MCAAATRSAASAPRRWRSDAVPQDFQRIAPATRIFRTDEEPEPGAGLTLHTVTSCDLASRELRCEASAVMGPPGRVFYVSGESVYVWTTRRGGGSAVFRLPLDGTAPSAWKTAGAPVDQFSPRKRGRLSERPAALARAWRRHVGF